MPVPNDLTPEEEQEFAQHGVSSAGPGSEPVIENEGDVQQREGIEGQEQRAPAVERRPNGQFASREEREAAAQQSQGQQDEQEGQEESEQDTRTVPLAALHAERQRSAQLIQRMQMLQTRTNMLLSRDNGARQEQEQMPDLNEDPAGYIQALDQRLQRFEQGWQQDQETRRIDSNLENDEATFALAKPDYHVASDYYVNSRARELLTWYPPEQAQQILLKEAREIARQSWQRNMSAAETIYNLATARGYNPNAPDRQGQQGQQEQHARPSARDVVEGVRNGQQASRSLSGGAGGGRGAALNAEALLNMSDEEFAEHLKIGERGANERFAAIG